MTRKIVVETDYAQVVSVKATFSETEANSLLQSGEWTLLHGCVAHQDQMGYQAKPCWLLGKIKKGTTP